MKDFTYEFKGRTYEAAVEYFFDRGDHRYRVKFNDTIIVLAICGWRGPNNMILWLHALKPGEIEQPHDLVQAIGEGIEKKSYVVSV
jgi:hypothetical protein